MVALCAMVPLYLVIAALTRGRTVHVPALPLDDLLPLWPPAALVYGALYLFLIVLPVVVIRRAEHLDRVFRAWLLLWGTSYLCFLLWPTVAPRPEGVPAGGFGAWSLAALYRADTPFNCLPSIHVGHSFVSALACWPVHRGVGVVAVIAASLVAASTLLAKQHYVADLCAGLALAVVAYRITVHRFASTGIPAEERAAAPVMTALAAGLSAVTLGVFWIAWRSGVQL